MSEWRSAPLSEVTLKIGSGATPRGGKGVYRKNGVAFIRSQNVYDHYFVLEEVARISDEAAAALAGVTVERDDVLVNITGESVTRTCTVDPRALPARVSQHVAIVRANPALVNPAFLRYSLLNPPAKALLNTLSQAGATRRALTKGHLDAFRIHVPALSEQQRIAGVLGAFDDLIETNRSLADRQEDLARALVEQVDEQVAFREIGAFPSLRQRRPNGVVDHFSIPAFDAGRLPALDTGDAILSGKYVLPGPAVLISRLNPGTPRAWMAYPSEREAVCSPEFVVARGRHDGASAEEVWAAASRPDFWKQMQAAVGGTTNSRQRVDKASVPEVRVPDVRTLQTGDRQAIVTLVQTAGRLRLHAEELADQRDELLPLLMSGKVRVSELEGVS